MVLAFGAKTKAPVDFVTVKVPYVPILVTVVPPSVPEMIVKVRVSPGSTSAASRVPVVVENVSTPIVSVYAAVAGVVNVGALLMVTEVVEVFAVTGPVLPAASAASFASKRGMTVPFVVQEAVTVRVVAAVSAPGSKVQVDVPVLAKSASATPVTGSENVSV